MTRLDAGFFDRPVLEVAPELLGCVVTHAGVGVRLTEVEAYDGSNDPGSHAFRGETPRTRVMFGPPGGLYVYFTYGMHHCANLVCGEDGRASAVLLRAGEVVTGIDLARERRTAGRSTRLADRDLARGPARLVQALGITRGDDGVRTTDPAAPVTVVGATRSMRRRSAPAPASESRATAVTGDGSRGASGSTATRRCRRTAPRNPVGGRPGDRAG
ncbi:putative 3-methyladenine DNA glycosylase [Barrientosiimonas endolithica]|uniref:Putative 3-methyladenine DNA glycosylase n=1 Tax=Barrientosiimonas endolithica TaxID=1535208 RepID=A0ABN6YRG5_9MICO|nr:putative 3-methyladenine DNA glycosylase [Barrientosiimonas endolithica]